jgi:benzoyl-CoA reductase/2-hydroxyglutaryl-CoA dehydratase subunit BcrC/BadD/HgdB
VGNHFHIIQIPFDVQIDQETGFAHIYHIFSHFEKTIKEYSGKEMTEMTLARFE